MTVRDEDGAQPGPETSAYPNLGPAAVGSGFLAGPGESDDDSASGPVPSDRLKADRTAIRILVVEDEWFIAMETEAVLHDGGYSVIGNAATAEDAVAIAGRERPDLVMDIRLRGDRDGIDAALEIRSRFGVPCIFATAHSEPDVMARGAAAEPLGWLTKPFSGQQLLREVEAAVERLR